MIGGNGFRAVGVISALEAELQRAVVTANQVLLWALLRAAGATRAASRHTAASSATPDDRIDDHLTRKTRATSSFAPESAIPPRDVR